MVKHPYGYIYLIRNKINNKTYIGCRKLILDKRWRQYMGSGKLIKKAIEKYGESNFTKTLIEYSFNGEKELKQLEDKYIKYYKSMGCAEYNIYSNSSSGGNTFNKLKNKTLDEVRQKQSIGIKRVIENGGGSAKIKINTTIKYNKIFQKIGDQIIQYYLDGHSLLDCKREFNLPVERVRIFLTQNGVLLRNRRITGHKNNLTTNQKISNTLKNNLNLKSGETLMEAHNRLIKYSYNDLRSSARLKDIYKNLNVSENIFNRFVRDHNKLNCEYCV